MKVAIHGLGRMGSQIAQKLVESGTVEVIAHNRQEEPTLIEKAANFGATTANTKEDVLNAFQGQQLVLWMMLPSNVIKDQLAEWLKIIPKGSIIIDGGNSDFRQTIERNKLVTSLGSTLVDIGVSGGIWGYTNGFSMMAGSDSEEAFNVIKPLLEILAKPKGGYDYFGPSGSGHFVKMAHNAIEYGMMESLAEGYQLLKEGPFKGLDLKKVSTVWQQNSVITSWLNQLISDIMTENPNLNGIEGKVSQSGEAKWALEVAKISSIDMPVIYDALKVRIDSESGKVSYATKLLAAMRNKFGGHKINV